MYRKIPCELSEIKDRLFYLYTRTAVKQISPARSRGSYEPWLNKKRINCIQMQSTNHLEYTIPILESQTSELESFPLTQTAPRTQPLPRRTCLLQSHPPRLQFLPVRNNRRNLRGLCLLRVRRLSRGSRSGFRENRIYSLCRNASLRRRIRILMSGLLQFELLIYHIFYT